ncbi:MAG: T9SS type A sorting domain-containing protein [Flavobacterium sp.]
MARLVQSGANTTYTLSTPFAYNGTDNLIIVVNAAEFGNDGNSTLYLQSPTTGTSKAMMIRSDTAVFDATNPTKNYTGTFTADSWQQKTVRPIITINMTTLGNGSVDLDNQFSLYPNPATDFINLGRKFSLIEVYDTLGKLVLNDTDSEKITVASFSKGMYIIKATDENGNKSTSKFVKN